MKQTAVEWLVSELRKPYGDEFISKIIEQAKEMEQQQIIDAYVAQMDCTDKQLMKDTIGKQYYNETYQN